MIYVLSGGQTGATLTVTSSGAGTITVSNTSLGKSYSRSVTAGGSAVFKGLATGTWTVKLSNGTQTSTKTITITSDYSTSIAYFSATISITYPATSTCVVTNSGGQTVASDTNTGSSTKTWTATVDATGTYTVTATATDGSGKTKSTTVSITTDGQSESVTLMYRLYLFNAGDKCTEITGGWEAIGYTGTSSKITTAIYVENDGPGYVYTKGKINTTGYTKLCFNVTSVTTYEGVYYEHFGLASSYSSSPVASVRPTGKGVWSADISKINNANNIVTLVASNDCRATVDKVWLE